MCIFVSAKLHATAAPDAPAPMIKTSTGSFMPVLSEPAQHDRGRAPRARRHQFKVRLPTRTCRLLSRTAIGGAHLPWLCSSVRDRSTVLSQQRPQLRVMIFADQDQRINAALDELLGLLRLLFEAVFGASKQQSVTTHCQLVLEGLDGVREIAVRPRRKDGTDGVGALGCKRARRA